jgi:hypothetical protein
MIDAAKIDAAFRDSLFKREEVPDGEPPAGAVIVQGVLSQFGFHKARLESHREEVREALAGLPDGFHSGKGGGQSFLNACMDKDGNQWGEHRNIEQLISLGIGLGYVAYCLPKEAWQSLPGGMPYFSVTLEGAAHA